MSGPGKLAITGSVFALPLTLIGGALTFAGWVLQKLGRAPDSAKRGL